MTGVTALRRGLIAMACVAAALLAACSPERTPLPAAGAQVPPASAPSAPTPPTFPPASGPASGPASDPTR